MAANIAAQVADALAVAHAAGLVHRDIKPANILLSEDGRVMVGRLRHRQGGRVAPTSPRRARSSAPPSTSRPSRSRRKPIDGRTDLYSLGVVLYEMLCGRVPFEADTSSATALARLHSDPQRPRLVRAGVPRELEAITMRLLARDPAARFPTATDVRAALLGAGADDRAAAVDPTTSEPVPGSPVPPPPSGARTPGAFPAGGTPPGNVPVRFRDSERRWLVPTLLVVLVAVALGLAGLLIKGSSSTLFGDGGGSAGETPAAAEPASGAVTISGVVDFDPRGHRRRARRRDAATPSTAIRPRPGPPRPTAGPTGVA